MQNSNLKNSLIAAGIAVFAGVVTLGANVAFGGTNPVQTPAAAGLIAPTFNGLDVQGNEVVSGTLGVTGDSTLNNLQLKGYINNPATTVPGGAGDVSIADNVKINGVLSLNEINSISNNPLVIKNADSVDIRTPINNSLGDVAINDALKIYPIGAIGFGKEIATFNSLFFQFKKDIIFVDDIISPSPRKISFSITNGGFIENVFNILVLEGKTFTISSSDSNYLEILPDPVNAKISTKINTKLNVGTDTVAGDTTIGTPTKKANVTINGGLNIIQEAGIFGANTALKLTAGNPPAGGNKHDQITFGMSGTNKYMHAIRTRHDSNVAANNALDFYIWDQVGVTNGDIFDPVKQVMTLNGSGNVGIGTTAPTDKLQVTQSSNSAVGAIIENTDSGASAYSYLRMGNNVNKDAGLLRVGGNNSSYFGANSLSLYTYGANPIGFITNNLPRMIVNAVGNVGIGSTFSTASPSTQLHVDGATPQITLSAPSGGTPGIVFRPYQTSAQWNNPAQAMISATDNNYSADIHFNTKTPGALSNALVERMTIQNNGNLGLGITTPVAPLSFANSTGQKISFYDGNSDRYGIDVEPSELRIYSGAGGDPTGGITFGKFDETTFTKNMTIRNDGNVNMAKPYYNQLGGTTRALYIDSNGYLGYAGSSERFKENIKDVENVSWLYNLRPVIYNYIKDQNKSKKYGLIAEEVAKVNPSIVSRDENGTIDTVLYEDLFGPIIKAIQNQKSEIDKLKEENAEIKSALCEIKPELNFCR